MNANFDRISSMLQHGSPARIRTFSKGVDMLTQLHRVRQKQSVEVALPKLGKAMIMHKL